MAKRILVVDDELDTVKVLAAVLRKWGFDVETALNGAEALEVLARIPIDGMTIGIRMPRMDGYEVIRHLRRTDHKMPVIVVTGWPLALKGDEEDHIYLTNNVQALFPKPVSSNELKPAVDRWFGPPS